MLPKPKCDGLIHSTTNGSSTRGNRALMSNKWHVLKISQEEADPRGENLRLRRGRAGGHCW